MSETLDSEITVFEDRANEGDWRVEYFDDDGGCYITIFAGVKAEERARGLCACAQGWHRESHVTRHPFRARSLVIRRVEFVNRYRERRRPAIADLRRGGHHVRPLHRIAGRVLNRLYRIEIRIFRRRLSDGRKIRSRRLRVRRFFWT
jgi:hypothetical protein